MSVSEVLIILYVPFCSFYFIKNKNTENFSLIIFSGCLCQPIIFRNFAEVNDI